MISVTKAILHTMDAQTQQYYLSDEELILDVAICEYIIKHVEKVMHVNNAQKGKFKLTSKLLEQVKEYSSDAFIGLSRDIANTWLGAYLEALRYADMNLLCVEFIEEDTTFLAVLQFKNKGGYIRTTNRAEGSIKNEIVTYSSLLPSLSQTIDEFFIINLDDYSILLKEDKKYFNAEEELLVSDIILYCDIEMSMKDSIQTINQIVTQVSNELDEDVLDNTLKMKRLLKSCVETDQEIEIKDICPVAFPNNKEFEEKFEAKVVEAKLPDNIPLQAKIPPGIRRHKIRTDVGIEISIPVDYADSKDTFNIIDNSDGTVSIELKHVGKILK